jgi:hypothetical protein
LFPSDIFLESCHVNILEAWMPRFYRSLIPMARNQVGEDTVEAAWAKGREMTLAQAIDYALEPSNE